MGQACYKYLEEEVKKAEPQLKVIGGKTMIGNLFNGAGHLINGIANYNTRKMVNDIDRRVEENTSSILYNRREIDVKETDKRKERDQKSFLPKEPREALKSLLREEEELVEALLRASTKDKKILSDELRLVREDISSSEKEIKKEMGRRAQVKEKLKSIRKTVGL